MADEPPFVFWHGGPTVRGDMLLPPSATGRCRSDLDDVADGWVYVTPTRSLAEVYAATCRGWVYEDARRRAAQRFSGRQHRAGVVRRFRLSRAECDRMAAVVRKLERIVP